MNKLSPEQIAVIGASLEPLSVVACAGSGKTRTAVHRLAEIRKRLGRQRGRVALLSFSNVAVNTFRADYQALVQTLPTDSGRDRVEIDTLDGFITSNVLRPHAYRSMNATKAAFLVMGGEPFLDGFKFKTNTYPLPITEMQVGVRNGRSYFYYRNNDQTVELDTAYATGIVKRLGAAGAYTHSLGRYWCFRTLQEQQGVLRALSRRYPHILIDESQDIGTLHQAILERLIGAGSTISLIGDPNQGIYEFAGANGRFLAEYGERGGVSSCELSRNYRSVPAIVAVANKLSGRTDDVERDEPETPNGAFFIPYKTSEREQLVTAFQAAVLAADLKVECSAVLCRGRDLADKLAGKETPAGQGVVKDFAQAAILRDKRQDYLGAFKAVVACVIRLLANPPIGMAAKITQPARYPEFRPLRCLLWGFARNAATGLPAATLVADAEWHPHLLARTKSLLALLEKELDLAPTDNLGNKLAKRGLPSAPLMADDDLAAVEGSRIRVDTVHQAKGESLDAVLYMATKDQVAELLAGVDTEVGRIGYVAVTRARNLLWLGVPANAIEELRPALLARGFQEVGTAAARAVES